MMNKSGKKNIVYSILVAAGFMAMGGSLEPVNAQVGRDPFAKPQWAKPKTQAPAPTQPAPGQPGSTKAPSDPSVKKGPVSPTEVGVPPIEARINYFKMQRERAAEMGLPLPKVTSVLTLDEMAVTGIFKTPRGNAAMVEAKPINLSYTIYPGEKFFDGQLVAVEENKLVFRKVKKMSNGKFVSFEESKVLRQYSMKEEVQGTAPMGMASAQPASAPAPAPSGSGEAKPAAPAVIVSPLDEMNKQPAEAPKAAKEKASDKDKKGKAASSKKAPKVAKN